MEARNSYSRLMEELRTNRQIEDAAIDHVLRLETAAGRHAVDTRGRGALAESKVTESLRSRPTEVRRGAQIFGSRSGKSKRLKPTRSASTLWSSRTFAREIQQPSASSISMENGLLRYSPESARSTTSKCRSQWGSTTLSSATLRASPIADMVATAGAPLPSAARTSVAEVSTSRGKAMAAG